VERTRRRHWRGFRQFLQLNAKLTIPNYIMTASITTHWTQSAPCKWSVTSSQTWRGYIRGTSDFSRSQSSRSTQKVKFFYRCLNIQNPFRFRSDSGKPRLPSNRAWRHTHQTLYISFQNRQKQSSPLGVAFKRLGSVSCDVCPLCIGIQRFNWAKRIVNSIYRLI
jgi:hypothetical protein